MLPVEWLRADLYVEAGHAYHIPTVADVERVGTHIETLSLKRPAAHAWLAHLIVLEHKHRLSLLDVPPDQRKREAVKFREWLLAASTSNVTFVRNRLGRKPTVKILFACVDDRLWWLDMGKPPLMKFHVERLTSDEGQPARP